MVLFWVVAGVLAAAAASLILFRAAGAGAEPGGADPTQSLYRRQISEIGDLVDRGLMGEAERKSAEAEAGRRLLAAADAPVLTWDGGGMARDWARGWVLAAAVAAPALALGVYLSLGSPGVADQPYAKRLKTWQTSDLGSLSAPEVAAVLRQATAKRPTEAEGFRLLGLAEAASQNPIAAARALRKAAALAPERADIWRMLGQASVVEAGGKIDAEAKAAFEHVLALEPGDQAAQFFLAQAKIDAGDTAGAAGDLRALLARMPAGTGGRTEVEAALTKAEGRPAPATADPARQAMIQGMVASLAGKLKANPDDPAGWVRLVRAYAVLGDTARRDEAYATARARYSARPPVLQQLDEAARTEPMQ